MTTEAEAAQRLPEYPPTVAVDEAPLEAGSAPEEPIPFDVEAIRADFPILQRTAGDWPLVYLDSANTSQKPQVVIDAMVDHLERHNANVARAMHQLGAESTEGFEGGRDKVAAFLNAPSRDEVIFTKNASEALNLVANTLAWATGPLAIGPGDEVLITEMEHHSNIVPWQLLTERKGARLRWFGLTDDGRLDTSNIDELINERTKVVSLTWVSNMLGTINPVAEIARRAHAVGAIVVVDGAQAVPQMPVDLAAMDADSRPDFLAFTGHKVTGPTGIGVLWGRRAVLEQLPPFLGGGEMIATVAMERSTYADIPHRFEAGTPPIVEAVGLGAAVDYLAALGMENVRAHEEAITAYALEGLTSVKGVTVLGPQSADQRGGAISFEIDGIHPHDVSQVLDSRGIAVRAGHHCAKPAHKRFGVQSSTRMSSYVYTTPAEIDALVEGLEYTKKYFRVD
ncbi:MAG: cysteine desulfurase [Nocardioidaceae bacterium]